MEYCFRWVWEAGAASLVFIHSYFRPHVLVASIHGDFGSVADSRLLNLGSVMTRHKLLQWACNRNLPMVELVWLLLSQWFSCLAQLHLRGRRWTNFSPCSRAWMIQDHHLPALQWVGFALASRSSTERLGDFSESVVFHVVSCVSCLVVLVRCLLGCGLLLCLFCFGDTLLFAFSYSPTCGNSQSKTKRFDDRLSLERARHELKKKHSLYSDLHSIPASLYCMDPGFWEEAISCLRLGPHGNLTGDEFHPSLKNGNDSFRWGT